MTQAIPMHTQDRFAVSVEIAATTEHPIPDRDAGESTLAFESFGLRYGITVCTPMSSNDLAPMLPPWSKSVSPVDLDREIRLVMLDAATSPIGREGFHWFEGSTFHRFSPDLELAIAATGDVIEHVVAETATTHLFVHAGVVGWREEAVILPGSSFSGKSTLVTALVNAGATYLSDEYAPFKSDGLVTPYPRHLSQRKGPFGEARRVNLAVQAPTTPQGFPAALVLLLRYDEGATLCCERLSAASAIMAISEHTAAIRRRPADAFAILGGITANTPVMTGVRGDASTTAGAILEALDAVAAMPHDIRGDALAQLLAGHAGS